MSDKMHWELMNDIPVNDHYADDSDSDSEGASIAAVATTVDSFRYENGRRYHAYRDGQYWGANDEINASYEKVVHHLFLRTMRDKLHLAPLSNPKNIVDLGTGTGLWAMDIADQYEDAKVLGIDLSPVPPTSQPNVEYEIDDVTSEWTHSTKFDFIHLRCMYGCIEDWPQLYKQCLDHLEPGGWIEQAETSVIPRSDDGTMTEESIFRTWLTFATAISNATEKPLFIAESMKGDIERAGFVDVVEKVVSFPIGSWSSDEEFKVIGKWYKQFWLDGMEGWVMATATRYLNWTPERVREIVQETKRQIEKKDQHVYYNGVIVYGRKPEA